MYGDLILDQLGVNLLGPAPLDLELLHMLTTFHWNALGSTLGWWFCHNNTVSCNEKFWVEQVTVPHPPLGKDKGWGRTGGGGFYSIAIWGICLQNWLNLVGLKIPDAPAQAFPANAHSVQQHNQTAMLQSSKYNCGLQEPLSSWSETEWTSNVPAYT